MKKLILACLLVSTSNLVSALNLDVQRDIFAKTLSLQEHYQWVDANHELARIPDYPLTYLAEYNYLTAHLNTLNDETILGFIESHKGTAASDDLQRAYLFHLAEQKRWQQFLVAYPKLPNNRTLQCHYLQASIKSGQAQKVWADAKRIWLNSTSLPDACDDVYSFYQDQNILTQADIWQRFHLAYEKNRSGLMRFLMTKMTDKNAALASQLYDLNKKPENLLSSQLFTSRDAASFSFLVPTIKRLARKDFAQAMQAYTHFEKTMPFTFTENVQIKIKLATIIVQQDKSEYLPWLDKQLPSLGNVSLIEQRIRYAIKRDDWDNTAYWLTQLPDEKRHSTSWLYWQARVLENSGDLTQARALYQQVAKKRSYHGFMAAQKLGINFPLNADIVKEEQGSLRYLHKDLTLIEELLFHKLNYQAKRQWNRLLNKQSLGLQQQLGLYAYDRGWAYLSVLASINSKSWDALNIRFPDAKPELFVDAAEKYDLEETYIYAITRRESSFDEHARSPVGASGYMQLMPRTAKETAKKIGLEEYNEVSQLEQGEVNVQLGTAYFDGLLKRYNGNRILATAAYNAGPTRVDQWFRANKENGEQGIAMDSWVESIPYRETRAYVKNILVYNVIYQHILDKPLKFVKDQELLGSY
ncbi:lytic murein transglycosylase [Psychromonas sp. RZ22]|uniref:transglycosylase SLT domain-containing protein n=1 Tax=Psychromonas algarum TaxID=2555643 RepID=UPI0010672C05|nr:transglycosylase SLT domain-containing protein [Psychromonas sp. RZ22]TEW56755.1 lytic murein transglycosylase [Psychromonas sp. RZ22]